MVKIIKFAAYMCCVITLAMSCKHQKIYQPQFLLAQIPISIDWSASLVDEGDINNVSVYFYPENGGEPIVTYSTDPKFALVSVPEGTYNILIHNEMAGNIKGIDCDGDEGFYDYKMSIQKDDVANYDMFYKPSSGEQLIKECEAVASWSYESFDVTKDMINYTRTKSFGDFITQMRSKAISKDANATSYLEFPLEEESPSQTKASTRAITKSLESLVDVPTTALSSTYKVNVEIENMNNIQHIEGVILGFIESANVQSKEKTSASPLNYTYFIPNEYKFNEGSTTDGSMSYLFTNLGHRGDETETYNITFNIILQTGELVTEVVDITDQLVNNDEGAIIEINIGDSFNNGTSTIVLPSYDGGGFGVNDWGEAENVIL